MDTQKKAGWLKALRFGGYKQTKGKLKSRQGAFCCLGLLCEIQNREWRWRGEGYGMYQGSLSISPDEVVDSGVTMREARILADMNDGGSNFYEIADYIEAKL